MLRRCVFLSVGALALLVGLGAPGQLHAQRFRGGFRGFRGTFPGRFRPGFRGAFPGRFTPGFRGRFDRGSRRGFFDSRFGRFDRFEDRLERGFNRGFFTPRFTPGFRPGMFIPF
jgi:hypothetical protein